MDMSIAPVAPLDDGGLPSASLQNTPATSAAFDFSRVLEGQLDQLNADVHAAETSMKDLASGRPVELHELMINLERARVSVQVFMQVRNKLVESYQDLMRMQM
jgi:flagellar hook-basal body complex protein FliE